MRLDTRSSRGDDSVAHEAWLARSEVNRGSSMLGWRRMGRCSYSSHPRMLLSLRAQWDDALGRLFGRSYQLAPMSSARLRPDQWRLVGGCKPPYRCYLCSPSSDGLNLDCSRRFRFRSSQPLRWSSVASRWPARHGRASSTVR